jgi:hypothetical protein
LEKNSLRRVTRAKFGLERGETNGKKQSLLTKICDGRMFHQGTTGNDDDDPVVDVQSNAAAAAAVVIVTVLMMMHRDTPFQFAWMMSLLV